MNNVAGYLRDFRPHPRASLRSALAASSFLVAVPLLLPAGGVYAACSTSGTNQTCTNNATISGGAIGVSDTGTLTLSNIAPGDITGTFQGLNAAAAVIVPTNTGAITGTTGYGIFAGTNATVTNNTGGTITGNNAGISNNIGTANVINSGTITGTSFDGINVGIGTANVTNSGTITGNRYGIADGNGTINVTNSGTITGTTDTGIIAATNATVTNNSGGTITGGTYGIAANTADVTNSGTISGNTGIFSATASTVFNAGTITGTGGTAISFGVAGSTLTITPTSIINGDVVANFGGSNTFQLGGTGTGTFDISAIGPARQYSRWFDIVNKVGASTWTVTGTGTYTGGTTIYAGTLVVAADNSLGAASGGLAFDGGTLQFASSFTSNRVVTLNAGGGTFDTNGNNATLGGTVGGAGSLTKVGTGTLTLTGANTYGGITTISAGTLQIGDGGTSGTLGTGNVTNNATLAINRSNAYTYAGVISGAGAFQQIGTGTTTLTGTNTYSGATAVDAGTLSVNGSIASSSGVTVNNGGTLGGTGILPSTVVASGGTLAPGNSIGTITVNGNLTFNSGSTYAVQVSGPAADRTNVTGTATLAGTVQAAFSPGVSPTTQYTILHSAGLVGTFGATTSTNPNFSANLSYTATDVLLNVNAALGAGSGLTGNQQNVAGAINTFFNNGGTLPPAFGNLFGLTGGNLGNALSQLSGEAATGSQQGAFQLTNQFFGIMLDPLADSRDGIGGGPALGFSPERVALPDDAALAYASALKPPAAHASFEHRWSVWGSGYGGVNSSSGDPAVAGSHDLTARAYGFAGGFDYRVSRDTIVGFALAGGGTNWGLSNGLGGGKSDAFQAGVYGVTRAGPAYLAGALSHAAHWMSTDRVAFGSDRLTASFLAHNVGARIETGYRFGTAMVGVTPYGAVQGQLFYTPSYSEIDVTGGGFGLSYDARTATAVRTELGARFDRQMPAANGSTLVLRARAAWAYDHVSDPALTASFQALPGSSFIVNGAAPVKSSALLSGGSELRFLNGWSVMAKLDGEVASRAYTVAGTAKVKYAW